MSHNDFLKSLSIDRSKDAEVFKKPEYAGIMNIVTELYPDNAHFIYELLQNAEDTEATQVEFILCDDKLIVEHNGLRLFTENDVKSITSIGNSSKREDVTNIGKFGVGFKAVFSYTDTPNIYSGNLAFKIRDLIVPELIESSENVKDKTIFIFPFNNPKKPAALAVSEIDKGLCALGDNTLLFLSHIRKISYSLPDGSQGSLERIDHENGRIEIRAKHPHSEETVSHWLHFHKDVVVTDSESNRKKCRVAIAYQLEKVTEKNKNSENWKIIPIQGGGQVSIYFPAEKETSKLRFHIHAPFASTVARDSVRDCDDNKQLRDHLADLITESLSVIRDQKMLVMSFLAVLPNAKDELAKFYERIREKIVHEFRFSALTPTKNGDYSHACFLYRSSSTISNLISNTDLKLLINDKYSEHADWVANAPQRNQREDNFLDSLGIDQWDMDELFATFESIQYDFDEYDEENYGEDEDYIKLKNIKIWFEKTEDDWLRRFYALLNDDENNDWEYLTFPIVRVECSGKTKHITGENTYFLSVHGDIYLTSDVNIVKSEVYTKNTAKQDIDENAKAFLESIGVRPFDEKAAIELRLGFYHSTPPKSITDQYYDDIKRFIGYWKANRTDVIYSQRKVEELFKPVKFLLGMKNGSNYWKNATDICLDSPIMETGLSELVEIHEKFPIFGGYSEKLTIEELKDFVGFLKAIGVMYQLEIIEARIDNNPKWRNGELYSHCIAARNSDKYIANDYSIEKLDSYLNYQSIENSHLVWNALIRADKKHAKVRYRPNAKYDIREEDSQLMYHLKNHAWIPNKNGEFCKPQDMSIETLHDEFKVINSLVFDFLLKAIGFGEN